MKDCCGSSGNLDAPPHLGFKLDCPFNNHSSLITFEKQFKIKIQGFKKEYSFIVSPSSFILSMGGSIQ